MAQNFPERTPGFMSHILTVLKAYNKAEFPSWREYDYAFRDKMASTGVRDWTKLDSTSIRSTVVPTRSRGVHSNHLPNLRNPNPEASSLPMIA